MNSLNTPFLELRQALELTQAELAEALGVSRQRVNMYERGRGEPSPRVAQRFLALAKKHGLEFTMADLYPDEPCSPAA